MNRTGSVCLAILVGALPIAADSPSRAALGERLYIQGIAGDGRAVSVTVQSDLQMRSIDFPCINCHRRSGLGSFEGPVSVPPVTGPVLFQARTQGLAEMGSVRSTGEGTRPAYDEHTLLRALRDGIDPSGRPLSPTMPRYVVGEADVAALSAYLRSLGATPPPGVTASTLHLATITSTTLDAPTRAAVLDVLRAFVAVKNGNTRQETRRRERGPWDMKAHYEGYRRWMLHEWSLDGNVDDWPSQLAAQYARQPVFAVVSGAVDGGWWPIHEFCEQNRVPCILPQTPVPPIRNADESFYPVYFSKGLALEAATLAHLVTSGRVASAKDGILQIVRCGSPAELIAPTLTAALEPRFVVRTRCLESSTHATADEWRSIVGRGAGVLVAWVQPADLIGLADLARRTSGLAGVGELYLSSSLLGDDAAARAAPQGIRAFLLHPFVQPEEFDRHAWRALAWLKARGIEAPARRASVNALFAATAVADVLSHPRTISSREYFIERLEHMIGRTPQPSAFPALSLGPRRHFASLGCYVLKLPTEPGGVFSKVLDWWVPEDDVFVGSQEEVR